MPVYSVSSFYLVCWHPPTLFHCTKETKKKKLNFFSPPLWFCFFHILPANYKIVRISSLCSNLSFNGISKAGWWFFWLAVIVDVVVLTQLSAQFNGCSVFYYKAVLFLVLFVWVERAGLYWWKWQLFWTSKKLLFDTGDLTWWVAAAERHTLMMFSPPFVSSPTVFFAWCSHLPDLLTWSGRENWS